jgi:two-component system chemotaxis sensor kinase CheA
LDASLRGTAESLQADRRLMNSLVNDLLAEAKHALMQPMAVILRPYPKMVRDIARSQGKSVALVIEDESISVDKRILDRLADPLTHLLRNAVDHGVELPGERRRRGKPEQASITLSLSRAGGNTVEVRVADDGCGINLRKVAGESVKRGLLDAATAAALNREEKLALFRALIVRSAGALFALPTAAVERIVRVPRAAVTAAGNRISWRGEQIAVQRLDLVLALRDDRGLCWTPPDPMFVLIVSAGGEPRAFSIDAAVGEQEVLLKDIGPPLSRSPILAGATVLGAGEVVPVLDASDLVAAAGRLSAADPGAAAVRAVATPRKVLIVEDSITSRVLLKHLLEGAGYAVETAVDGMAAMDALRRGHFDLILSDIQMPRMDGLELTRRIRADRVLAPLPVVLLTAYEAPEDEACGLAAGANAYMVKSRFDRDSLLDGVARLVESAPV